MKKTHILGVAGTFMGGIASLAKALGHQVSGSDANIYPPMSTQLAEIGLALHEGYEAEQLDDSMDEVVVGNALGRGRPVIEALLEKKYPLISGPMWLAENVLRHKKVLAVSGTHGKTTTASLLAWILESAGLEPGFLLGGKAKNFKVSARLGDGKYFVLEADEYDSAFFDKRSKFIHYRPEVLIINNLEFDHADIFENLEAIQKQFHGMLRVMSQSAQIFYPANDSNIENVFEKGCWSQKTRFKKTDFAIPQSDDLLGQHNQHNAVAAIYAARSIGVSVEQCYDAIKTFKGVARRLEFLGEAHGVRVFNDFAHHPTAIQTTLETLKHQMNQGKNSGRLFAFIDLRSNSMVQGVHQKTLTQAVASADAVYFHHEKPIAWNLENVFNETLKPGGIYQTVEPLVEKAKKHLKPNDTIVLMSNGAFGGLQERILGLL